jgi:Uma2 family endonuclease
MNAPFALPFPQPRPLLASDVMFLVENGLIDPNAKFELVDGAILQMSPKGRLHEAMRERLTDWLRDRWCAPFRTIVEHTLIVDAETILEPDFILYDRGRSIADAPLAGSDIRLVIEVADTSWSYDTNEKAQKYARFGVGEYWAVNAASSAVRVHRTATKDGWADVGDIAAGEPVTPLCAINGMLKL